MPKRFTDVRVPDAEGEGEAQVSHNFPEGTLNPNRESLIGRGVFLSVQDEFDDATVALSVADAIKLGNALIAVASEAWTRGAEVRQQVYEQDGEGV